MVERPGEGSLEPVNLTRPSDDFDSCAALVQQRARLESALPTTDNENAFAGKLRKVPV